MCIEDYLRRQAGVISREQARVAGLSRHAVDRRLAGKRWLPVLPRVYLDAGRLLTDEARLRAAMLWAGPEAVASGAAAAWWSGMTEAPLSCVKITIPKRQRRVAPDGIVLRRRDLPGEDVEALRGLRVTAAPLTALEAAVELGSGGSAFLDRALQRHVRFAAVHRAHCRDLGRAGSPAGGALLTASADRAGSAAERLLVRLLRAARITGWVLGHPAEGYRIDLAFPASRVAVEVDGWAWHVDQERFQADRRRQNVLVRAGWIVLRFTWHDLTTRPRAVIAEILAALARA